MNTNLLNTLRLNTQRLRDGGTDELTAVFDGIARFGAFLLDSAGVVASRIVQDSMPDRDFRTFDVPRNDGGGAIGSYWRNKKILIYGVIKKDTNAELEAKIDEMKKYLATQEGNLDIMVNNVARRYVATLTNASNIFSERKHFHVSYCPFSLEFLCLNPFGQSLNYQADTFEETSLAYSDEVNNAGTAKAKAVVSVNFSSADTVTVVNWKNTLTGDEIEVSTTFSAGDILEFNTEKKSVTLNGTAIDFDGVFPELEPGLNSFTLTITGTSATYSLTIKHKTPFL